MENVLIQLDLYPLFDNTFFFLTFIVTSIGIMSVFSKSFVFAGFASFIMFASITITTSFNFYVNLLLVIMVIILLIMSFQIYNMTKENRGNGI